MKQNQMKYLNMKNAIAEMKNSLVKPKRRLDTAKENISKLECLAI